LSLARICDAHQDEYYIPTRDRSLCASWIALDDATIDNGCLWVIPGSHRQGVIWPMKPVGWHVKKKGLHRSASSAWLCDAWPVVVSDLPPSIDALFFLA
jgi:ectoine hydroxylase-related dioxygenase (phytanoyl-CoA dioxygenase family)